MIMIKIPAIHGYIDRRILINYTVDPDVAAAMVPAPFSPLIYNGRAIVGICLIRLKNIKPKGFPNALGVGSENGAHRFAVVWDENGVTKQGVYIPRRDTSSLINALAGGRVFPGKHHRAAFTIDEQGSSYDVSFISGDATTLSIKTTENKTFNSASIFGDLQTASAFFQNGCVGYTPTGRGFEGIKLQTYTWQVSSLDVHHVQSSYFENEALFPKGSVIFDSALLMKNIEHEWQLLHKLI